jgi:LacI family transcriptional regulator
VSRSGKVTIHDVARRAGVAISTVSMVMRGSTLYSAATKKAVLEAVAELRYSPSIAASSLSTGSTNLIAICGWFVSGTRENFPTDQILKGIMQGIRGTRYALYMVHWSEQPDVYRAELRGFSVQRFVSGSLWFSSGMLPEDQVILRNFKLPVVQVESSFPGKDSVAADNVQGGYLGAKHLLEGGRRRIGLLVGGMGQFEEDRLNGCKKAFEEAGLPWRGVKVIKRVFYDFESGYRAGKLVAALGRGGKGLDGLFSLAGDRSALGAMRALKEAGLSIPQDLAVVGYDGLAEAGYADPALSSVEQPLFEMGKKAVELLIARMENKRAPIRHLVLPVNLIRRQSS